MLTLIKNLSKIALLAITASCATVETRHPAAALAENFAELGKYTQRDSVELRDFGKRGPFKFERRLDQSIRLSSREQINTDLFMSAAHGKSPLVIISHGNDSDKADHQMQGEHLASWGMHVLVLQLPNRNQWLENGLRIKRLVDLVQAWPSLLDERVDLNSILLVGHSFGGSAVSVAAANGAKTKGLILLDPAIYNKTVEANLQQNKKPIVLIGADKSIFKSKRRQQFFNSTKGPMAEISVRGATHDDAQYPATNTWQHLAMNPFTSEQKQRTFLAALTAASVSLAATGTFDGAWEVYSAAVDDNILTEPRRKL